MAIRSYRDLTAWQEAMRLVTDVYKGTKNWPREETYGLTPQARRAAVSVPSNIAEGQGRRSSNEFRNHLSMVYGSLMELETQVQIASDLDYQTGEVTEQLMEQAARVGRLINALSNALPKQRPSPTTDH